MYIVIGGLIGVLLAFIIPFQVQPEYSTFVAVAILAALDSVVGGITSYFNKVFDMKVFVSGFFVNALLAAGLTYLGRRLGIDISLAAIVTFGTRLFQNFATIRRQLLFKQRKINKDKELVEGGNKNV